MDPDNRVLHDMQLEEFYYNHNTQYIQVVCQANSQFSTIVLPSSKWLQFHYTFLSLIDDNESLSNFQKFYYLKSCMKKDAEFSVLKVTDVKCTIAWGLLNDKFIINRNCSIFQY